MPPRSGWGAARRTPGTREAPGGPCGPRPRGVRLRPARRSTTRSAPTGARSTASWTGALWWRRQVEMFRAPVKDSPSLRVVLAHVSDHLSIALKRLDPDLPVPQRAHPGDAGVDLCSTSDVTIEPGHRTLVGTGIAIALPVGTVGLIHPRSGLAAKSGL